MMRAAESRDAPGPMTTGSSHMASPTTTDLSVDRMMSFASGSARDGGFDFRTFGVEV